MLNDIGCETLITLMCICRKKMLFSFCNPMIQRQLTSVAYSIDWTAEMYQICYYPELAFQPDP